MSSEELIFRIALGILPGIGDINARKLVDYIGSIEGVFKEPYRNLVLIPGIGSTLARKIVENRSLQRAEKEFNFLKKYNIKTSFYLDEDYPARLKECPDAPVLIFYKGTLAGEANKVISIVGTRNATRKGREICSSIIEGLARKYPEIIIVSGLAYGIDICAHKSALKNNLSTIGVMAHGFKTLYPSSHTSTAKEMLRKGALVTDFLSDEPPDRNNFLKRNRIIAGMADATLVVESGIKGGAMVTADIAMSYNRDVLAIPGYPKAKYSSGCNMMIKSQKASLVESESDIEYFLNWSSGIKQTIIQQTLKPDLSPQEAMILDILEENKQLTADQLSRMMDKPVQHISSALLTLEFSGYITALPGNIYRLREL